jgi:hypothetical protein
MDPELKILLEQLISAVNSTNNTDWWMWGVTAISIVVSAILSVLLWHTSRKLGKRQNEIAEQQTEIQKRQCEIEEYDIYKEIHRDVYNLSKQSNLVLPMIYCYVASDTAKDQAQNVKDLEKEFTGLFKKLAVDDADFILRKGKSDLITDACAYACFVEYLLGVVTTYKKKNRPEQSDLTFLNYNRLHLSSDEDYVNTINLYIPHDHTLRQMIDKFVEEKNRLFDSKDNLLERIRKSYKNEIN